MFSQVCRGFRRVALGGQHYHNHHHLKIVSSQSPNNTTISSASALASGKNCSISTSIISTNNTLGGGNRVYIRGSGIGTDSSMIAANDRFGVNRNQHDHGHGHGHGHIHEHVSSHSKQYFHTANHNVNAKAQTTTTTTTSTNTTTTTTTVTTRRTLSEKSGMDDEYGEMTADGNTYVYPEPFELESGEFLPHAQLRYMTYGTLNEERNNVLVVCHALTGNASLHSWWGDLLGPGQAFDTDKYFVVCCNILGSCYGSTGPASPIHGGSNNDNDIDNDHPEQPQQPPQTETYGIHFPDVSVRDSVTLQLHMLQNDLGIKSVKCVIGGSFGGMQAIEHAVQAGSVGSQFAIDDDTGKAVPFVRSVVPIACGAAHTAWQIGISEVQRQAIYADPKWNDGHPDPSDPPLKGLSVARQIGMVTYRTAMGYESKFGRKVRHRDGAAAGTSSNTHHVPYGRHAQWEVKSYLEYQGWKFLSRFDPVTYIKLTEQLDTHDVGRNRGGKELALSSVKIPAMIMGIDSDILYPIHEQEELANLFPNGHLKVIHSDAGHDGFLLEQEQVAKHIIHFLESHD
mmetsp:Transcript_19345/g.27200  ORF Transcript_19345/g.27200 Transcript_19345/m.27200 type:complete len:568 (+) Transcript_19345:527-2230(+)